MKIKSKILRRNSIKSILQNKLLTYFKIKETENKIKIKIKSNR